MDRAISGEANAGVRSLEDVVAGRLCHGCGACASVCMNNALTLVNFIEEGIRPVVDAGKCKECGECLDVCSGARLVHDVDRWAPGTIAALTGEWGPVRELWEGFAADPEIRFKGSSGGVATALALYCIENEGMAGALHIGMDEERPYLNRNFFSVSRADLVKRAGSRYAPASVCADLGCIEVADRPCVLMGKPCDIASAQMARRIRPRLDRNLGLTVSIFCAGTPSTRATLVLLDRLGVERGDLTDLRYRGHGWPGMFSAGLRGAEGKRVETTYRDAWDNVLTRNRPARCLMCPDGSGEFADISSGDPWYRPIEEGELGTSLILARTERGSAILHAALAAGYVTATPCAPEILPRSQPGLAARRRHVFPKLLALWFLRLPRPRFRGFGLWRAWWRLGKPRMVVSLWRALRYQASMRLKGRLRLQRQPEDETVPFLRGGPHVPGREREAPR